VLARKARRDVTLHVCRDGAGLGVERPLLDRALQWMIDSCNDCKLGTVNYRLQSHGPCLICWIAKIAISDLARDKASTRPFTRRKPSGDAKADESLGTFRNFTPHELFEPAPVPASRDGSHARDSPGDARLCAEARRGGDEARALRLATHIPTRTEVVLEAFKLR
jgi:hypothetical protein